MKTTQTNRVTMFKTVDAFLDQNSSVWSGMASLAAAVQQFKDKVGAIDAAAQKQETATAGAVANKSAARNGLEDVLFLICEALAVLGSTSNDHELVALVALSASSLHRLTEEEISNRATAVLEKANARKTDLAALHLTQANIDELDQALQTFKASKEKPRTATAERMAQTEALPRLISEVSDILRSQIDRLVNLFRRSNSEFVAGYRNARVIIDRAASHAAAKAAGSATKGARDS